MARSRWTQRLAIAGVVVAAVALACEAAFFLAWSAESAPPPGTRCAVLVLGYPARSDGTVDPVQRSRMEVGVAAFRSHRCEKLVISGGAAHNEFVEADVMARAAAALGVGGDALVLERQARNTWENVALSLPLVQDYDAIFLASESLHARRAKRYLCQQRADLCARAFPVSDYAPFRRLWWKVPAALYELRAWLRDTL